MNLESRLSGVPTFLRPDKLELLSLDANKEPVFDPLEIEVFDPLEIEGDLADGEDTFGTEFLIVLLPVLLQVLSIDAEETLLDDESEGDDFTEDFLTESCLVASELGNVLGVRAMGEMGTDFLVSEMLGREEVLVTVEGSELLRTSGRDRLNGSEAEGVVFSPATELTLLCRFVVESGCFSGKPPVLFLLIGGAEFKLLEVLLTVDLAMFDLTAFDLESGPLFGSIIFLVAPVGPDSFDVAVTFGFAGFAGFAVFAVPFTL